MIITLFMEGSHIYLANPLESKQYGMYYICIAGRKVQSFRASGADSNHIVGAKRQQGKNIGETKTKKMCSE